MPAHQEIGDPLVRAAPQVPRGGAGREHRDVPLEQVVALGGDDPGEVGQVLDRDPEPIEEAVPLQGVAQQVGVEALGQQQGVGARGTQDDAHFILGEARQGPVVGEQLLPVLQEQAIDGGEPAGDGLGVVAAPRRAPSRVGRFWAPASLAAGG